MQICRKRRLEAAILAFDTQVNERGMPILFQPKTLLINPSNRMLAKRLLNSAGMPYADTFTTALRTTSTR
jgi:hypothetical protein